MNPSELSKLMLESELKGICIHNRRGNLVSYCATYVPGSTKCKCCDYEKRVLKKQNRMKWGEL